MLLETFPTLLNNNQRCQTNILWAEFGLQNHSVQLGGLLAGHWKLEGVAGEGRGT